MTRRFGEGGNMTVPTFALGANGKPAIMLSPVADTAEFALPVSEGNLVKDLPVFRTGKVKDSKGRAHNWTTADLDSMVANFTVLKDAGKFPNVPVRANHGRDVNNVGGYYQAVRRKGNVLYADVEFTEPDMKAKYDRGTFRSRSIEIGAYESNDGEITFPAVMGLAFCDIPAVEGLYSAAVSNYENEGDREVILFHGPGAAAPAAGGAAPAAGDEVQEDAVEKAHLAAVMISLHALAGQVATNPDAHAAVLQIISAVQAMQTAETGDTPPSKPAPTAAGALVDTFKFSLNGTEIDVAGDANTQAVLAHFAARDADLTSQVATLTAGREADKQASRLVAVNSWLTAGKILPAQLEGMQAYVALLSDEQFAAHEALTEAAPTAAVLTPNGGGGGDTASLTEEEALVAEARQTYSMLAKAGLSATKLAASKPAMFLAAKNLSVEA